MPHAKAQGPQRTVLLCVPMVAGFKYDPEKDNGNGEDAVMRVLIDRQLLVIRRGMARSRRHLRCYRELAEVSSEPESKESVERAAFSMEVGEILDGLSTTVREACEAAARERTVEDAAVALGISRYRLMDMLRQAKECFEKAGF